MNIYTLKMYRYTRIDVARHRAIPGQNGSMIAKMARWLDGSMKTQTFYNHRFYRFFTSQWLDVARPSSHGQSQSWSGFTGIWLDVARCFPINSFRIEIKKIHTRARSYKPINTVCIENIEPHRTIEPFHFPAGCNLCIA